jgi:DNA primase
MQGRYPREWVDELFARADIVQVVSSYLPLTKRGQRYWGLCPFHNEKTASFSVSGDMNLYHCFGCKAGGNVVQFVMEMERMTFPEALAHLAKQLHMPLPELTMNPEAQQEATRRERLYALNREAAAYYHANLWTAKGETALAYLRKRGVDDSTIRRFGLGVSADEWTDLCDHLRAQGYQDDELVEAGIVRDREGRRYDAFRGRLMFPIQNMYGNVLGFGARALGNDNPKYLNTGDTPVFNKRYNLYATNLLRRQRDLKQLFLVEGYMDVIALSQNGIQGAVATLGTSLTQEQARLMKRLAPTVWIAYDGDEAGQAATERAIDILEAEQMNVRVLRFPDNLDPDDMLRQRGVDAFRAVRPISSLAFKLERMERGYDLTGEEGRTEFAKAAAVLLKTVADPVVLENHLKALAIKTGFSRDVLLAQVGVRQRPQAGPINVRARHAPNRPTREATDDSAAEKTLLTLSALGYLPEGMIVEGDFEVPLYRETARKLMDGMRPPQILSEAETPEEVSILSEIFSKELDLGREDALVAAEDCLRVLHRRHIDKRLTALRAQMESAQGEERQRVLSEIMTLSKKIAQAQGGWTNGKDVM